MGTTLATLRGYLNDELGVTSDTEDSLFSETLRNRAIADGYAALWRAGIRKPVQVDIASDSTAQYYTVTGLRELGYAEVIDSAGYTIDIVPATVIADGSGGYKLQTPLLADSLTIRLHGWTAYISTFADDSATDDLEVEYQRIPLLKAKAICYRAAVSQYARWQERQALPPELNLTMSDLLAAIAAAEREWTDESSALRRARPRYSQPRRLYGLLN